MKNYTDSDLSQSFKDFYRKEKSKITKILKAKGCTDIQMSMQFNYFYGFFTSSSGQIYYFNCSDVRHFKYEKLMYRTAKDYKDYSGGRNQWVNVNDLEKIELI